MKFTSDKENTNIGFKIDVKFQEPKHYGRCFKNNFLNFIRKEKFILGGGLPWVGVLDHTFMVGNVVLQADHGHLHHTFKGQIFVL